MTGMADAAFATADDPGAAKSDALSRHAVGRFGMPEDIARVAVWLASDDAAFVTGQTFTVDGGLTAASPLQPGLFLLEPDKHRLYQPVAGRSLSSRGPASA